MKLIELLKKNLSKEEQEKLKNLSEELERLSRDSKLLSKLSSGLQGASMSLSAGDLLKALENLQGLEGELCLKVILNLVQKLTDFCSLMEGAFLDDNLSRLIFGLLHLQRRLVHGNGVEIDLCQLKDMFRLQDVDQIRRYLAKLESLNVLQTEGDAVRIKNSDTLASILHVLSGQGKFVLKL